MLASQVLSGKNLWIYMIYKRILFFYFELYEIYSIIAIEMKRNQVLTPKKDVLWQKKW